MARKKSSPDKKKMYDDIIGKIFHNHYKKTETEFYFERSELEKVAKEFNVSPKNLGDILYTYRFRREFPNEINKTRTTGKDWMIWLAGRGRYLFKLSKLARIVPDPSMQAIKIPNATPEIIEKHAKSDEQALLARVRYNRLIDIFLGIASYSLQSHLRTTVTDVGQIEIDEVYVGVDRHGAQFVIPVQAKRGKDKIGAVQANQDVLWAKQEMTQLQCRPVAAQFMDDTIVLFELVEEANYNITVVRQKHYKLVHRDQITDEDLKIYRTQSNSGD